MSRCARHPLRRARGSRQPAARAPAEAAQDRARAAAPERRGTGGEGRRRCPRRIITLLPSTTRSPVKAYAVMSEREVVRRAAGRVQRGRRLSATGYDEIAVPERLPRDGIPFMAAMGHGSFGECRGGMCGRDRRRAAWSGRPCATRTVSRRACRAPRRRRDWPGVAGARRHRRRPAHPLVGDPVVAWSADRRRRPTRSSAPGP